jgi:hypothetical protein
MLAARKSKYGGCDDASTSPSARCGRRCCDDVRIGICCRSQSNVVSPTYPTRAPNPNPQRFDPTSSVWRTRATDHFDIYHTTQVDLDEIAHEAERAYSRVSLDLRHDLSGKVPLILLPTSGDLPGDRQEANAIVRASGAPDADHLLLSLEPRDRRATVLVHELTHIFQFELVPTAPCLHGHPRASQITRRVLGGPPTC